MTPSIPQPQPTSYNESPKRKPRSGWAGTVALVVLLALLAVAFMQRQALADWWRLRGYQPPAPIAAIADATAMTDYGRKVFYVNHPELLSKSAFRTTCPDEAANERTIVLGCYHSPQRGIFVLDVADKRLEGVEAVTSAHEMLHAAYDRLNSQEREEVDTQLQAFYEDGLKDDRVRQTIDSYRETAPTELVNEMHSILPTEVSELPAELDEYYKRYFTDRQKVVKTALAYQDEFLSRRQQVRTLDAKLNDLKQQIDRTENELRDQQAELSREQARLQSLRQRDAAAYNAAVPAYNTQVSSYNAGVSKLQQLVARYNRLVEQRNAIALEENELSDALDADVQQIKE